MFTSGNPSPADMPAVIARIAARRNAAGESFLETMPDDPAGAVHWVVKHPDASRDVLASDALDCLAMIEALRVTLDRRERSVLRLARQAGVTWQQIAAALGLDSRQAARQRMVRLEAALAKDQLTEEELSAVLRASVPKEAWLDKHAGVIIEAGKAMVETAPDGAPDLDEEVNRRFPSIEDVMIWMKQAVFTYPPGLCPQAEALVKEWDALSREGHDDR